MPHHCSSPFSTVLNCCWHFNTRPASAPPARGVHGGHHKETRVKNKSEAGVLLALSRMADGSSCAPGELRIMKWVVLRETYLTKLHGVVTADRKRAKSDRKRPSPKLCALLTELLSVLRRITVEIVEAVEKWRRRDKTKPFIWGSSNYLVKAAGDIEFLSRLPGLEEHLGVVVTDNPFLTHTGLDGRSTVLDRSSIRSRSGRFPLGTSESFGVSAERMAAAAAVLYREVQRTRRGRRGGRGTEEETRPDSGEPPRVDRSSSSTRHRPASSAGRRSPAGSGSDRRFSGSRDIASSSRHSERRKRPHHSPEAAVDDPSRRAVSPRRDDGNLGYREEVRYRKNLHREEQIVSEKETRRHQEEEEEQNFRHLGGDGRRVSQPARRRSSTGPEPTEAGNSPGHSKEARRSLAIDLVAAGDRPTSEERYFDGRRRESSGQPVRRRSSAATELTDPGRDCRYAQKAPRRSLAPDSGSLYAPRSSEHGIQDDGEPVHRDNRRATEVWHSRNDHIDGGRRRASQYERRRSTGSGDSSFAQRGGRRPSLPYYAAVVEKDDDESRALPPDDQSLDYQNGDVVYRDDYYYEQEDGEGAYHDDEQNLNYYYEQQEGGYDPYTEVEPQAGYAARDIPAEDEWFASRGNPDADPVAVDSDRAERRPSDGGGYSDYWPAKTVAPEDGAATDIVASAPLEPATSDSYHQQWSGGVGEPTATQPTETLPAVEEEARSSDDVDPQHRSHGRMGRRGSPFNLIFNMCDGMLTGLKGLGGRSNGGEDDAYHFEPMMLGDLADTRDRNDGLETPATGGTGDNHEEGGAGVHPAQQADADQNSETTRNVIGGGQAESPPPKLRGATYASLTRDIVGRSKEGSPKRKKASSGCGVDEGSGAEDYSNRILTASFSAWAERTEGRLRHRDAEAARHHSLRQLRHAMSAWEAHRAKFLGGRMADAFAGRFGLMSRFFVRFAFDALRTHAKGARLAARNRTAMEKFVTHLERFGRARLRQAWRRWAPPKLGPAYWGAEHEVALKNLCRHWGRGRLRGALCAWRQPEPVSASARPLLHKAGSFAVLKGKLKAPGSFVNVKASKSPQAPATSRGSRHKEDSTTAGKANSAENDSWAAWLGNEASVSIVSPDGEKSSLRADPEANGAAASNSSKCVAEGEQALSPARSFRGLGAALKSMKSFRDGRDKSQVRR